MTEKERMDLANDIVDKIIERQRIYDEQFKADIQSMVDEDTNIEFGIITQDEIIIEEMASLNQNLKQLESQESYEAAAIVANKIKHLKNKYNL